tara:strand:+ start:139 stop:360 length:222 start_codon:yes stop_codon:yes gene_type:complete
MMTNTEMKTAAEQLTTDLTEDTNFFDTTHSWIQNRFPRQVAVPGGGLALLNALTHKIEDTLDEAILAFLKENS